MREDEPTAMTSPWQHFHRDYTGTALSDNPIGFTESGRVHGGSRGRTVGPTINSLLEPRPRKFVGAVTRRRDNRQSRPKTDARRRGRHNGDCGAIFEPTQAARLTASSPEMRSMSDASSRYAGHVTKDLVVSVLQRTIRIIRRHRTPRRPRTHRVAIQ